MLNAVRRRTRSRARAGGGAPRPSLDLNFAVTKALDPRITFTRATTATYYDGTTAKAEENLVTQSQNFSSWATSRVVVTNDATTAPDGTTTADKVAATAAAGYHDAARSVQFTQNLSYTISIFVKASEYTKVYIADSSSGGFACSYDLTAATAGTPSGSYSNKSASIVSFANGFYRCILSFTATETATRTIAIIGYPDAGATLNNFGAQYTGDGTSGVFMWGAQLEQRSTATAYTPTTTTPITNYIPLMKSAASGVARFDHRFNYTKGDMNLLPYSAGNTARVGVVDGGDFSGLLPTGWAIVEATGLTVEVLANNIDSTLGGCRIKVSGTSTNTSTFRMRCTSQYFAASALGTCTISEYARRTAGSSPTGGITLFPNNLTGASAVTVGTAASLAAARRSSTGTTGGSIVAYELRFSSVNGVAYDFTVEIAGAQLETGSTANGYIVTGPDGEVKYINETVESLGLLVEEQRANLVLRSDDFSNAYWTKEFTTVKTDVTVAPDGTTGVDMLVETTQANDAHRVFRPITKAASSLTYTFSCHVKKSMGRWLQLSIDSGGVTNNASAQFDIWFGVVTSTTSAGTFSSPLSSIEYVGNGWYRCSVTGTTGTETTVRPNIWLVKTNTTTYTGDGFSGVYIWGAQLETGGFATSYIPTAAASATRNADTASMTGANFSSWWRNDEGTILVENNYNGGSNLRPGERSSLQIDDGSSNNRHAIANSSSIANRCLIVFNNSTIATITGGPSSSAAFVRTAYAFRVQSAAAAFAGTTLNTASPANIPSVTQMGIGYLPSLSISYLSGCIKRVAFYPARLPNAQLLLLSKQ